MAFFMCFGRQVNRQMKNLSEELCACRKELETQTTALKRAAHDREELAKDKAALDVKLNSAGRKACGLTQELVALRFVCLCMGLCICVFVCCLSDKFKIQNQFSQMFFCSCNQHKL